MPSTTCFLCCFGLPEDFQARAVYKKSQHDDIDRSAPTTDALLSNPLPYSDSFLSMRHNGQYSTIIACVTTNERPQRHDLDHSFRPFHENPIRPGYPIHEPCYKMLCEARGRSNMTEDLQAIYDICTSFPLSNEGAFWGHNYESLRPLEPPEGEEGFLNLYSRETFSLGSECHDAESPMDPNVMAELHDVVATLEHKPCPVQAAKNIIGRCPKEMPRDEPKILPSLSRTSNFLRKLPSEIISEILLYLPSASVKQLQLADPMFADAQNFRSFWKSRFASDREFWYINETMPHSLGDRWDLWYQLCRKYHKCPTASNRRRTWRLARRMCHLIDQRHDNAKLLRGSTSEILRDEIFWQSDDQHNDFPLCKVPNTTSLVDQVIDLPDHIRHVVFSFTTIANQRYISGFRLHGANNWEKTVGYFRSKGCPPPTCSYQSRATELIVGFDIALDNLGIRGLRILKESGKPLKWAGEQTGLPKRRLIVTSDASHPVPPCVKKIRCSFDAFKLVGIAICSTSEPWPSVSQHDPDSARKSCRQDARVEPEKEIWYPNLPPMNLNYLKLNKIKRPPEKPYHYCIFGGSRGERLRHLNKVIISADRHVRSVAFQYVKDGEKMEHVEFTRPRYGLKPGHDVAMVSLAIDGPGGERITRVKGVRDASTEILTSLQIFTNTGRTICSRTTHGPDKALSKDEIDGDDTTQSQCDTDKIIVGLFGTMMAHTSRGGISSLGVVCI